jgi:hypothetical protein
MMQHNALENRLNAVRSGKPAPAVPASFGDKPINQHPKNNAVPSHKQIIITESYKFFTVLAASLLYGYGVNAIFSTDWNFIGVLGVGFIANHFLTALSKITNK